MTPTRKIKEQLLKQETGHKIRTVVNEKGRRNGISSSSDLYIHTLTSKKSTHKTSKHVRVHAHPFLSIMYKKMMVIQPKKNGL